MYILAQELGGPFAKEPRAFGEETALSSSDGWVGAHARNRIKSNGA